MLLEDSVYNYLKEKYLLNALSKATIATRKYELYRFIEFCSANGIDRPSRFDEDICIDFLSYLKVEKNVTKYTQSTVMYIVNSYMEYLVKKNVIPKNYMAEIERPKFVYPDSDYLEFNEVKELFRSEKSTATRKTVARNILLLNMFFTLCLRASEAVTLQMKDLKLELKQVWIKRKGGIIAKFPLNDEISEQFLDWFKIRREYKGHDSDWIFLSSRGMPLTTRQARYVVSNALNRAGIKKRKKGTHILRHSGATFRLQNGENIKVIQKMLGHASMATTEKYLHYDENEVKAMIDRSPRMVE